MENRMNEERSGIQDVAYQTDLAADHDRDDSAPSAAETLRNYRTSMRRFADQYRALPVATRATCPICREVVEATFRKHGRQVILDFACPTCDIPPTVHADAIWSSPPSEFPNSHTQTIHGARIHPVLRRLPRTVETMCPQCAAIIVGRYFVEDNQVFIEKTCPEHGYVRDKISSNALLFSKSSWWSFHEHPGQEFPQRSGEHCPSDCGLCNQHLSGTILAQIDLTNRCNMNCPICFANANAQGFVFQPTFEEIVRQMRQLREMRPTPPTAIQFSGGEPTIHPDFLKVVRTASEMGFSHIQIATNGITLAEENFARQAHEAGLHTIYLQFDGIGDDAFQATRNFPGIWEKKLAALDNCRKYDMKVCLVPTLVKGINDDQIPGIFDFAVQNIDVVSSVSWQPVSFTGRMSVEEVQKHRFTLGDLGEAIAKLPGVEPLRDLYPVGLVLPISEILEALTGNTKIRASCHPDCAFGTYMLVSPDKKVYPFSAVVNVEGLFWDLYQHAQRIKKNGKATWLDKLRLYFVIRRHWRKENAPPDLTVERFIRTLHGMIDKNAGRGERGLQNYRTLMCAGMHFQDRYNFDVERVKRCVILYSTPAGVFPFCTHNCGPEYRYLTQAAFLEERGDNTTTTPMASMKET
jgi:hypothetical protein